MAEICNKSSNSPTVTTTSYEKSTGTLTHTQEVVTQTIMHTNPTADHNWYMSNQQTLQYEQRCNQSANVSVEPSKNCSH